MRGVIKGSLILKLLGRKTFATGHVLLRCGTLKTRLRARRVSI
jgi:hypothetical protein